MSPTLFSFPSKYNKKDYVLRLSPPYSLWTSIDILSTIIIILTVTNIAEAICPITKIHKVKGHPSEMWTQLPKSCSSKHTNGQGVQNNNAAVKHSLNKWYIEVKASRSNYTAPIYAVVITYLYPKLNVGSRIPCRHVPPGRRSNNLISTSRCSWGTRHNEKTGHCWVTEIDII